MRRYDAPLIARHALNLGAVQVELIERAPTDGPVMLEVCLPDHMVFVELKAGASCERRIDGGAVERFVSRPGVFSFRPAGSIVRGVTQSRIPIRYGAIRIDPLGLQNELATRMSPGLWRSATACSDRPIWQDALALLRATTQPRIADPMLERLNIEGHAVALLARLASGSPGRLDLLAPGFRHAAWQPSSIMSMPMSTTRSPLPRSQALLALVVRNSSGAFRPRPD